MPYLMNKWLNRGVLFVHFALLVGACTLVAWQLYLSQHPAPSYLIRDITQRNVTFALTPEAQQAAAGADVILNLTLDGAGQPFQTATVHLTYPSTVLHFVGIDDPSTSCNLAPATTDGEQILYCVAPVGQTSQILHLATLHFVAASPGTGIVRVSTDSRVQALPGRPLLSVQAHPAWVVVTAGT